MRSNHSRRRGAFGGSTLTWRPSLWRTVKTAIAARRVPTKNVTMCRGSDEQWNLPSVQWTLLQTRIMNSCHGFFDAGGIPRAHHGIKKWVWAEARGSSSCMEGIILTGPVRLDLATPQCLIILLVFGHTIAALRPDLPIPYNAQRSL